MIRTRSIVVLVAVLVAMRVVVRVVVPLVVPLVACTRAHPAPPALPAGPPAPGSLPPSPITGVAPPIATPPPPTPAWERWPTWAYLEAGSATLRAQLEDEWGGLGTVARGQLPMLASDASMPDVFAVTFAALRGRIDAAGPIRQLARRDGHRVVWAIAFAAGAPASDPLPAICQSDAALYADPTPRATDPCRPCVAIDRPGARAIVCGFGDAAEALRGDFLARGLSAAAGVIRAEQHDAPHADPSRAALELHADGGALHGALRATPARPPTRTVSVAARAAASRVAAGSPRVEVGAFSAFATDLDTPLRFDSFDLHVPTAGGPYTATMVNDSLSFIEMPVARLAPHMVALWRSYARTRVDPMSGPRGLPPGTRRYRHRSWVHDDGDISICTPQRTVVGGCKVVGHRPPSTTLASDGEILLIPSDGGTWISIGGGREMITALVGLFGPAATPPTWTLPAVALGKQSTAHAELYWAAHLLDSGELALVIDGALRP